MRYFVPADTEATLNCFGNGECSKDAPIGLDDHMATRASHSERFVEVNGPSKAKSAKKKAAKKKVSKKKAAKK